MLLIINYVINLPILRVPRPDIMNYLRGLFFTLLVFIIIWSMLGLSLFSYDLLLIVLINDYLFFAPILQELIDEVDK